MSKAVKAVTGVFGGMPDPEDAAKKAARNASTIGGEMTPEQMAEQRAALAAQGRRAKEQEVLLGVFERGTRPLQGGGKPPPFWT